MSTATAVLVTGASTGIGRVLTERLAADGHLVYAGARKPEDLRALRKIANVQALRLDVTSPADVAEAFAYVSACGDLYGLVNNAGILTLGSVIESSNAEFERVIAVNVTGTYRVTKVFAPLIAARQGRIVTISSIAGVLAAAEASAYSMSKHALEALSDSLALELAPLGVKVSVIEPGSFRTQISSNTARRIGQHPRLEQFERFKQPDEVAVAVMQALFDPQPKRRYLVVPEESEAQVAIQAQVEKLAQLNENHLYTFDRSVLFQMLDQALSRSRSQAS